MIPLEYMKSFKDIFENVSQTNKILFFNSKETLKKCISTSKTFTEWVKFQQQ